MSSSCSISQATAWLAGSSRRRPGKNPDSHVHACVTRPRLIAGGIKTLRSERGTDLLNPSTPKNPGTPRALRAERRHHLAREAGELLDHQGARCAEGPRDED